MVVSLFYGMILPCKKKFMNMIESVVYCAAGLILLSLGAPIQKHAIGNYLILYASLIFLVCPSLIILVTFVTKIFTCLCCICDNKYIQKAKKVFNFTISDGYTLFSQQLPDRLEHPLDYEPLN